MATTNETEVSAGPLDTILLVLACLVVLASLVAYYYYYDDTPTVVRVLGIMASLGIGVALTSRTQMGRFLWQFIQGSRVEIRKVIWPTRPETTQTTLAVFAFVTAFGVFFWVLDFALLYITRALTGQGG